MRSLLTVTTAANELYLLTEAEAREASGIASGQDDKILNFRKRSAAIITSACNVRAAGAQPATLLLETLSETIRLDEAMEEITLARRPIVEVVSIVEDAVTLVTTDYEIDAALGSLRRLSSDYPAWWMPCKIVVAYRAGWATVPENLKLAAMRMVTLLKAESSRDPNLKEVEIPGLIRKTYWVSPNDDPLVSAEIDELLKDFRNPLFA
jgi:hypothetical protein